MQKRGSLGVKSHRPVTLGNSILSNFICLSIHFFFFFDLKNLMISRENLDRKRQKEKKGAFGDKLIQERGSIDKRMTYTPVSGSAILGVSSSYRFISF